MDSNVSFVDRLEEHKQCLKEMLASEDLKGVPFLFVANKQDLPTAMNPQDMMSMLNLSLQDRPFHVVKYNRDASDFKEGLDWMV